MGTYGLVDVGTCGTWGLRHLGLRDLGTWALVDLGTIQYVSYMERDREGLGVYIYIYIDYVLYNLLYYIPDNINYIIYTIYIHYIISII